jgi:UDP-N-acetylmuramate: L-alanyl-gamma-D-glutamyl-meso-diaminopimelate ligase
MKIHLIAIGGSAMHNMALALHEKGYEVSGSDDEIFEPSKGRLAAKGLLPEYMGWNADRVTSDIDAVILGMHARENNPELKKAQDLGLKIFSYPEYIFEQSKDKIRVVIGGSHGKTTITSMVLHVMNELNMNVDYMVGAKLEGYETMVKLTKEAKYIVLEGDEYLSSPIDRRPKFHLYKPHIAMISGIAWDHINVFPTFENYVEQFEIFANSIADKGDFIYCSEDKEVVSVANKSKDTLNKLAYGIYPHRIEKGITILDTQYGEYEI